MDAQQIKALEDKKAAQAKQEALTEPYLQELINEALRRHREQKTKS
jgi:hypothetical protein